MKLVNYKISHNVNKGMRVLSDGNVERHVKLDLFIYQKMWRRHRTIAHYMWGVEIQHARELPHWEIGGMLGDSL